MSEYQRDRRRQRGGMNEMVINRERREREREMEREIKSK